MVQCGIVGDSVGSREWRAVGKWRLSPRICGLLTYAQGPLSARELLVSYWSVTRQQPGAPVEVLLPYARIVALVLLLFPSMIGNSHVLLTSSPLQSLLLASFSTMLTLTPAWLAEQWLMQR